MAKLRVEMMAGQGGFRKSSYIRCYIPARNEKAQH